MFFIIKLYLLLNCVLMLNWIVWNRTIFIKMDLVLNNLQSLICHKTQTTNQPRARQKKYFASPLIWKENFSTLQAKFCRKINWTIIFSKAKFQAAGSVNNLNKKAENPRSGRKLTARCSDNVDAVRDSVRRSPNKSLRSRFQEFGLSRAP